MAINVTKAVIKILQGNAVTQIMEDELVIHPVVANFLWHISAKNYESGLHMSKLQVKTRWEFFLRHSV